MTNLVSKSKTVGRPAAVALALGLFASVAAPVTPVLADAVKVEAPQAPSFADVVEAVSPAVVSVRVKAVIEPASAQGGMDLDNLPEGHPLREFFQRRDGSGPEGNQRREGRRGEGPGGKGNRQPDQRFGQSQGSGFFVSEDGYIVTNNHVVENGSEFEVVMNDGKELAAKLVGTDPKTDLAVLKVDGADYTYVGFADKPSRVGEWVVAVGNPFGLGGTVTAGIVSASERDIGSGPYDDFIQIDAAVNKGNSGGPAFDLSGNVIGVNTAIFSPSGGNVGIAFAISARSAKEVVDDLISDGLVSRGYLGVQIQPVSEDIAASLDLPEASGSIVAQIDPATPAGKAGIQSGDVVTKVDGTLVEDPKALSRTIAGFAPGTKVALEIVRGGKTLSVDVTLGELPGAAADTRQGSNDSAPDAAPVELADLGLSITQDASGPVVAEVDPEGTAADKGVNEGDAVVSVNGRPTADVDAVGKAIAEAVADNRKAVLLQLRSQDRNRFVALPMERG